MEAVVLDTIGRIFSRVHDNMLRGCVEYVSDTNVLQISDVTNSLAIADDDALKHLVAVHT